MNIELYQELEEEELVKELISIGVDFKKLTLVEIKDDSADLFGDFIVVNDWLFKKIYSNYQCLATPTERHEKQSLNFVKANGDRGKNYFTRYKTSKGGVEGFNPVTKTGGVEKISTTKKRLGI
jgi:hypothetical protein